MADFSKTHLGRKARYVLIYRWTEQCLTILNRINYCMLFYMLKYWIFSIDDLLWRLWGFRSVNQRSFNNQWVNSLADMFRGLFLSSVPVRISISLINVHLPRFEPVAVFSHSLSLPLGHGTHWYLWQLLDQLTNPYNYNVTYEVEGTNNLVKEIIF